MIPRLDIYSPGILNIAVAPKEIIFWKTNFLSFGKKCSPFEDSEPFVGFWGVYGIPIPYMTNYRLAENASSTSWFWLRVSALSGGHSLKGKPSTLRSVWCWHPRRKGAERWRSRSLMSLMWPSATIFVQNPKMDLLGKISHQGAYVSLRGGRICSQENPIEKWWYLASYCF